MKNTFRFMVSGRVQGVFFRASCKGAAERAGVMGWVRNLPDGRVEGMATGDPEQLRMLRDWLKQGPERARVDKVEVTEQSYQVFDSFEIR
jgi:acylphosphatase